MSSIVNGLILSRPICWARIFSGSVGTLNTGRQIKPVLRGDKLSGNQSMAIGTTIGTTPRRWV